MSIWLILTPTYNFVSASDKEIKSKNNLDYGTLSITWPRQWGVAKLLNNNCSDKPSVKAGHFSCRSKNGKPAKLSFGQRWQTVEIHPIQSESQGQITEDADNIPVVLDRSNLRLKWPLKNLEPWIGRFDNRRVSCDSRPKYKIAEVSYCATNNYNDKSCKHYLTNTKKTDKFFPPALDEVNWSATTLPAYVFLQLKYHGYHPKYKKSVLLSLPLGKSKNKNKEINFEEKFINYANLEAIKQPDFEYSYDTRLMLYNSRLACNSNASEDLINDIPFAKADVLSTAAHACAWGKLVRAHSDISYCAPARQFKEKIQFKFTSNKITGKRKLIIVANSSMLGAEQRDVAIQDALLSWLNEVKNKRIPLNLISVNSDGSINQVLRGEDLEFMKKETDDDYRGPNIRGAIFDNFTFSADGYQPLKDLSFVERKLEIFGIRDVEKVVYFSDQNKPAKIYNADLGTPLGWSKANVELHVVTNGACDHWIERAYARCTRLKPNPKLEEIKKLLDEI